MLYFSTICSASPREHFALFRHKKQSLRNCCRILNINLVIGIYKSNISKLWMLPTPGQASANPNPANCRCFRPRPGICSSNTSKLQILPTLTRHLQVQYQQIADTSEPGQASATPQNNKSKMPTGELSSQIRRWASLFHLYFIFIVSLFHQIAIYVSF